MTDKHAALIERVALAICRALGDDPDREGPFSEWFDTEAGGYGDVARAAIEALQSPSIAEQAGDEAAAREVLAQYGDWRDEQDHLIIRAMIEFAAFRPTPAPSTDAMREALTKVDALIAAKRAEPCSFGGQREAEALTMEQVRAALSSSTSTGEKQ